MDKQIKERGIIFNGEMVRAVLDGRKTQTRRIIKLDYERGFQNPIIRKGDTASYVGSKLAFTLCPFGQVGDRLYVREAYAEVFECDVPHGRFMGPIGKSGSPSRPDWVSRCVYKADGDIPPVQFNQVGKYESLQWTPSIHMPRWASRITLEITDIRVERLNDISEADAISEGLIKEAYDWRSSEFPMANVAYRTYLESERRYSSPKQCYQNVWESIYGQDSWQSNPFVWVIKFRRLEAA